MRLVGYVREVVEELEGLGLAPEIVSRNVHYRIRVTHPVDRSLVTVITVGGSESDCRACRNTRARIRRFINRGAQ